MTVTGLNLESELARLSIHDDGVDENGGIGNSNCAGTGPDQLDCTVAVSGPIEGLAELSALQLDNTSLCAKLKVNELLFTFMSLEPQRKVLLQLVQDFENGAELLENPFGAVLSEASSVTAGGVVSGGGSSLGSPVLSSSRRSPPLNINIASASLSMLSGAAVLCSPPRSPQSGPTGFSSPRSGGSGGSPRSPRSSRRKSPLQHSIGLPNRPLSYDGEAPALSLNNSSSSSSGGSRSPTDTSFSSSSSAASAVTSKKTSEFVIPPLIHKNALAARVLTSLHDRVSMEELDELFVSEGGVLINDFVTICKDVCGFPTFFSGSLCRRIRLIWRRHTADPESKDAPATDEEDDVDEEVTRVTKEQFLHFWQHEMAPYDELDRFFFLIKHPDSDVVVAPDFTPILEELLTYHPGLEFLENTPEFQEKYARTVIARIFYEINTSWNGQITRRELRRSDLLKVCHHVDEEEDINAILRFFSYEHFYTLYVKFWEIDTDHDFLLSKEDLLRHGGHSLTPVIIDRIFEQPVYKFFSGLPDKMGFEDFVFFFLAEEDKTCKVSLRYWFSCIDLDGDGTIQAWEMYRFFAQQISRLQSFGQEVIPFADVLCQAHDLVHPKTEGILVLSDFTHPSVIHISGVLFNILFNLNKFMAFEQRDPYYMRQQFENPHFTDWDRFAAVEYARLASAEEKRESDEEHFATWGVEDDVHHGGNGRSCGSNNNGNSWLQYNESPF